MRRRFPERALPPLNERERITEEERILAECLRLIGKVEDDDV